MTFIFSGLLSVVRDLKQRENSVTSQLLLSLESVETTPFPTYLAAMSSRPEPPSPQHHHRNRHRHSRHLLLPLLTVFLTLIFLSVLVFIIFLYRRLSRNRTIPLDHQHGSTTTAAAAAGAASAASDDNNSNNQQQPRFSYSLLRRATGSFSASNQLGLQSHAPIRPIPGRESDGLGGLPARRARVPQ